MNQPKEKITVGRTTMHAVTVPVNVLFDRWEDEIDDEVHAQRFRLIELDGYFLVSIENFGERIHPSISFKCFIESKDAWDYLEMYGIEREEKPEGRTRQTREIDLPY